MQLASQIVGIVASAVAIFAFQLRRKWQMLVAGILANLLNMVVFLMLNGFTSAMTINLIAVVQCSINAYLYYHGKVSPFYLKILFLVLFLVSGFAGYSVPLDLLPIAASVLFMCSVFQPNEQKGRVWSACNVTLWIVYDLIVGTTAVFGQIISLLSIFIGLYRYRERRPVKEEITEP